MVIKVRTCKIYWVNNYKLTMNLVKLHKHERVMIASIYIYIYYLHLITYNNPKIKLESKYNNKREVVVD